jgi:hypothetical protein
LAFVAALGVDARGAFRTRIVHLANTLIHIWNRAQEVQFVYREAFVDWRAVVLTPAEAVILHLVACRTRLTIGLLGAETESLGAISLHHPVVIRQRPVLPHSFAPFVSTHVSTLSLCKFQIVQNAALILSRFIATNTL